MQTVMNILGQGIALGAVYLLGALGLTIIYGVMGVVNLAHGELIMLGSYVIALTAGTLGYPVAVVLAFFGLGALGYVLDATLIRFLYHKPVASMLGTWGLAMVLRQAVILLFGAQLRYVALPIAGSVTLGFGANLAWWRIVLIVCSALAAVAVAVTIARTRFGVQMRAVIANPAAAESLGVRAAHVNRWTFALGCGLAGLAGALVAPLRTVFPGMGLPYLVGAFLVVILAGLGNVRSTIVWSLIIGIGFAAVAVPASDIMANIVVWCAALAIIAARRSTIAVARV
ncbi:MAG: urea transport system permease protein [Thermoleophilaceae bacterium]|jgi:urea transport system permease protein|nr:urea transport system permease protein [Thermoleophilaceae bacterium]